MMTADLPSEPNRAMLGYYILFAMDDDIPSFGQIIRIVP